MLVSMTLEVAVSSTTLPAVRVNNVWVLIPSCLIKSTDIHSSFDNYPHGIFSWFATTKLGQSWWRWYEEGSWISPFWQQSFLFFSLAEEMLGPMGQATMHFHDLGRCSMNANSALSEVPLAYGSTHEVFLPGVGSSAAVSPYCVSSRLSLCLVAHAMNPFG